MNLCSFRRKPSVSLGPRFRGDERSFVGFVLWRYSTVTDFAKFRG